MMRRPLVWAGVCLILLLALGMAAKEAGLIRPPSQAWKEQMPEEGENITIQGTAARCILASEGMRLSVKDFLFYSENTSNYLFCSDYQIFLYTDEMNIEPGDRIKVRGETAYFKPAGNPGQFDAEEYYTSQNYLFTLKDPVILQTEKGPPSIERFLHRIRRRFMKSYEAVFSPEDASVLATMSLGETGQTERERKLLYQEGGIAHILAISGLHISLLGMGLYRILRRLYLPVPAAAVLSGTVMGAYLLMTGISVSAARAVVMFWLWLGAQVMGRAYDRLTGLFAAALVLLAAEPEYLLQASFIMSFLAVFTLAVFVPAVQESCGFSSRWANALLAGAALQAGTLPCVLFFFKQVPVWSFLVNLAVVPLMPAVMGTGLLGGAAGIISPQAGIFLGAPCGYLLKLFDLLCLFERKLPGGIFIAGQPSWWKIAVYYAALSLLLVFFRTRGRRERGSGTGGRQKKEAQKSFRRKARGIWLAWLAGMLFMLPVRPPGQMEVYVLDVGQGDSILIREPSGMTALIDGGSSSVSQVWRYRIKETLKYFGIRTLDYVFLTHGDADHINGIQEFLEEYERGIGGRNTGGITLKRLIHGPEAGEDFLLLESLAAENGIPVTVMEEGGVISYGEGRDGWKIRCLAPDSENLLGEKNQDSLVLLLSCGNFRMLFTGDMEKEGEERLLGTGAELTADVLKAGHHGAANASSEEFLREVNPRLAVISCGENNRYGHPSPETLRRLQEAGSQVCCTAWEGAVKIASDGEKCLVETYLEK